MKLYKYSLGNNERLGIAEDDADAYERRTEVDHTFDYLPVVIEEIVIPGYVITVMPDSDEIVKNKSGRPRKMEG